MRVATMRMAIDDDGVCHFELDNDGLRSYEIVALLSLKMAELQRDMLATDTPANAK